LSRDQLRARIDRTGDAKALEGYNEKSKRISDDTYFKEVLKGMKGGGRSLTDALKDERLKTEEKANKEADLKQLAEDSLLMLKDKGFFKEPHILDAIANKKRPDLVSAISEFIAKEKGISEQVAAGKPASEIETMMNVEIVKKVPGYTTVNEWRKANPDKLNPDPDNGELDKAVKKLRVKDGQLWRSQGEIDYLILQKPAAGSGRSSIIEPGQVKSGTQTAESAKGQHDDTQKAIDNMLAGDTDIQAFLKLSSTTLGDNVTPRIDFSTLKGAPKVTVGPEGRKGFTRSLGLRSSDIQGMADEIIKNPDKYTK
jgi:hypothetical protein